MELRNKRINYKYLPGFITGTNGMAPPPGDYTPFWQNSNLAYQVGIPGSIKRPTGLENYRMPISQSPSFGSRLAGNASNILSAGLAFGGSVANSFGGVKSAGNILDETGYSFSNGIGYGYQKLNDIDYDAQRTEIRKEGQANTMKSIGSGAALGSSIGSVAGPIGSGIGAVVGAVGGLVTGLFGAKSRKRRMERRLEEARVRGININNYNQSSAQSDYIANQYYNENGTTQDDVLYAKRGKDAGYKGSENISSGKVLTSLGKTDVNPNARVAAGESIIDNINDVSNTTGHVVKTGVPGRDTNLANLQNNTIVLGQDIDWRNGMTFKDQSMPYTLALEKINKKYENRTNDKLNKLRGRLGQDSDKFQQEQVNKIKQPIVDKLKDLSNQQAMQHQQQGQMYTEGNLPGFKGGYNGSNYGYIEPASWMSNAVPMGIGMLSSVGQYFNAKNQSIHTPDIYAGNPYEQAALNEMAKLRVNPYRAMQKIYDQDSMNRYNTNRAGGLSGAQKYLANVAAGSATQQNIADTIQKAQEMNNQYRSRWAEMAANLGSQTAQRRQQANQYNTEYASQAHAARQQGMQMGLRNFLDYIQQYAANEYKRKTGNGMLGLYQQKIDMEREAMKNYYNKDNKESTDLIVPTQPVVGKITQPSIIKSIYDIPNPGTIKLRNNNALITPVRTYGYPTTNVEGYTYTPANYITNFTQMPPISYHKWNNMF